MIRSLLQMEGDSATQAKCFVCKQDCVSPLSNLTKETKRNHSLKSVLEIILKADIENISEENSIIFWFWGMESKRFRFWIKNYHIWWRKTDVCIPNICIWYFLYPINSDKSVSYRKWKYSAICSLHIDIGHAGNAEHNQSIHS